MQVDSVIREIIKKRGASMRGVSASLEKSQAWARNVAAPGRSPALATVADIADVLGYDVAIIDRETGEQVGTIEPPRRKAEAD